MSVILGNGGYFHRVAAQTTTRLWINNPTGEEADLAIEAGAIGCTTNPAYCARLLRNIFVDEFLALSKLLP